MTDLNVGSVHMIFVTTVSLMGCVKNAGNLLTNVRIAKGRAIHLSPV